MRSGSWLSLGQSSTATQTGSGVQAKLWLTVTHLDTVVICRTRKEFQQWAEPLAEQYGYAVRFWGAGKAMAEERALAALGMQGQDLGFASQVTDTHSKSTLHVTPLVSCLDVNAPGSVRQQTRERPS